MAVVGSANATAPAPDAEDKVSTEVQQSLEQEGAADVFVRFSARPNLGQFAGMSDRSAQGQGVYDALTATADESQAQVREQLDAAGVEYDSYFIANTIHVTGADADLVNAITADAGVSEVIADEPLYQPIEPVASEPDRMGPNAIEWGVENINAPDVWEQYGTQGEGVTVATIDGGVQFDHPAMVDSYRGNNGDGTFTHDYNWFDAANLSPDFPADDGGAGEGHGTHVTGTIAGDDGGENQIGVAPGADWIATNGCCPDNQALLDSMQWVLAPTDLAGENADPDQRPHVVNNSWGTIAPSNDPFDDEVQEAWEAAGIFGVFSNGNLGPQCETSGSPGSRTISYSVGAYDESNTIADFSSRGPGQDGEIKPNISAPGVDVRSAFPNDEYGVISGTSMASPHVAGAIALLWSAAPDLQRDVPATRELLDQTAIDTEDTQCGGDAADNNVYGEGRLDALALVDAAAEEPPPGAEVQRVAGDNRWLTAAEIAAAFPEGFDTVYVANAEDTFDGADALAGGAAAARGAVGFVPNATPDGEPAPILLVKQGSIPNATLAAMQDFTPANAVILGGDSAISTEVEEQIQGLGVETERVEGENRYETAANLGQLYEPGLETVYVATGQGDTEAGDGLALADALTAASLAGSQNAPVLLTRAEALPTATVTALEALEPQNIVLVGGEEAVEPQVEIALDAIAPTERAAGDNRYETAVELTQGYAQDGDVLYVASGLNFPDALAGSSLTGSTGAPMVLANQKVPDAVAAEILRLSPQGITIVGGTEAVSTSVEEQLQELLDQTSTD